MQKLPPSFPNPVLCRQDNKSARLLPLFCLLLPFTPPAFPVRKELFSLHFLQVSNTHFETRFLHNQPIYYRFLLPLLLQIADNNTFVFWILCHIPTKQHVSFRE